MRWRAALFVGITSFGCITFGISPWAHSKPPAETSRTTPSESPKESSKESGPKEPRAPRLPSYYGQIGISDKQRLDLQNVQVSYEARLEKLRNELKALVRERDEKLENLLTDGQKLRLQELRSAAKEKRQKRAAAQK